MRDQACRRSVLLEWAYALACIPTSGGNTLETQASIDTWAGGHQTIHATAKTLGTDLLLQDAVRSVLKEGRRMGLGEHDLSALVEVFSTDSTD